MLLDGEPRDDPHQNEPAEPPVGRPVSLPRGLSRATG